MPTDVAGKLSVVAPASRAVEPSGREAELELLWREREEAKSTERARFVFVRGPAGVGKSHLFGVARAQFLGRGVAVYEGNSARELRRPFGVFSQLVPQLIEALPSLGVPAARVAELQRVVPLLVQGAPAGAEQNRLELYDLVCELFSLSGRQTPVFLLPDLDALDRASLELFRYLVAVSTTPGAKSGGLFVASFRDDAALPTPLSDVVSKVSSRTIALKGLDAEGIRAFLSRHDVAERLLQATGGNPEALGALLERSTHEPADFFLRRAAKLSSPARQVLDVLAAANESLSLEVLERCVPNEPLAPVVDLLTRERFVALKMVAGAVRYRFVRDSELQAWRSGLAAAQQEALRKTLAQAWAQSGDVIAAAMVLLETLALTPADAQVVLAAAAQLAARGAHEDAAELYRRALPSLPAAAQAQAHHALSDALAAQGDHRGAARSLVAALKSGEAADAPRRALSLARLLMKLGRPWLSLRALQGAATDPALRLEITTHQAEVHVLRGAPALAIEVCRAELALLDPSGRAALGVRNVLARALVMQGDVKDAAPLFAQNAAVAQSLGLKTEWALAKHNEGVARHKAHDVAGAISCYQAATSTDTPGRHFALASLGSLYADSGDFELALDHLNRALQLYTRFEAPVAVSTVASNLGRVYHVLGDFDRAVELSEHALALAGGNLYREAAALLTLGAVDLDCGKLEDAQRTLDSARTKFERVGNDGFAALAAALKARAHLLAAEKSQAAAELGRAMVEKGAAQLPSAAVEIELTRGELALQLGDLHGAGRAVGRAKDALLMCPDLEGPYRAHWLSSKIKSAGGDAAGAQLDLARASRALEELTHRVPPVRREAFLQVPRRSQVLAALEPELKLPRTVAPPPSFDVRFGLVGQSVSLARLTRSLEPIGRSNATVLIRGESGTGKELLADALHGLSPRRSMPIIKVNCAAMVEELLLSELFGHEKGAFTGAIRERKGRFELAEGGTLFLDEIGDISPKCQVALLRVLQERELERVGGTKTIKVDVRVICATNRDLEALIAQGRFRADLYYRLKGVMLELPPLRERLDDLPALAHHFLARAAAERSEPVKRLSSDALALLSRHSWPGNVRELENVLSAASIFAEGELIGPDSFMHVAELQALAGSEAAAPAPVATAVSPPPPHSARPADQLAMSGSGAAFDFYELARRRDISLKDLRHEIETQCIRRALLEAGGNISEAARLLKMKRSRLSQIVNGEAELKEVAHGDEE